jgi:tight adherence protein B
VAEFLALGALSALLALAAAALHDQDRRRAHERVRMLARVEGLAHRMPAATAPARARAGVRAWVSRRFESAGITPARWQPPAAAAVATVLIATAGVAWGAVGAALALAVCAAAPVAFVARRSRQRRIELLAGLPTFLDHVVRAIHTGSSLPHAIASATRESPEPIRGVFERVDRHSRLGASLDEALEHAAIGHGLRELHLLALVVHLNRRYGGSVRDVLEAIVTMIRQRERAQREFRALTGETRLSAWILALLPLSLATYIGATNPGYLERMWEDPAGRVLLAVAASLQLVGSLLLWRMVRSV